MEVVLIFVHQTKVLQLGSGFMMWIANLQGSIIRIWYIETSRKKAGELEWDVKGIQMYSFITEMESVYYEKDMERKGLPDWLLGVSTCALFLQKEGIVVFYWYYLKSKVDILMYYLDDVRYVF